MSWRTDLRNLISQLQPRRKRQLASLGGLMLVGALAEMLTLGAVVPFLAAMATPERVNEMPLFAMISAKYELEPKDILLLTAGTFASLAVIAASIRILLAWFSNRVVYGIGHDLGVLVFSRTLQQPYSWHALENSSNILAGISKVQLSVNGVLMPVVTFCSSLVVSAFIVAALILIDPFAATFAGVFSIALYAIASRIVANRVLANGVTIARTQKTRIKVIQEGLGGIRDVILDDSKSAFEKQFRAEDFALRSAQTTNAVLSVIPRFVLEAAVMVMVAVFAYYVATTGNGLVAALPTLGALALGGQKLMPLVQQAYQCWVRILGSKAALSDVMVFIELPIQPERATNAIPFSSSITLDHISFAYDKSEPPSLDDVSLTFAKGKRYGFIGQTGSGKSTLLDILMGLLLPDSGRIMVDDLVLTPDNIGDWQAQVAHVPQNIFLLDGSILSNIAFGIDPDSVDRQRAEQAAKDAQLLEFIQSLPSGFETSVGERGVRLSGGQRQRIGIARALYKRAQVLVLDEATSALDEETEKAIVECIDNLSEDITIFVIAHRVSTLSGTDLIHEVRAGKVVRSVPYQDLS